MWRVVFDRVGGTSWYSLPCPGGRGTSPQGPLLPWALEVAKGLETRVETAVKGEGQAGPGSGHTG